MSDLVRVSLRDVPRALRLKALQVARSDEKAPDMRAELLLAAVLPSERRYLVSRDAVLRVLGKLPKND